MGRWVKSSQKEWNVFKPFQTAACTFTHTGPSWEQNPVRLQLFAIVAFLQVTVKNELSVLCVMLKAGSGADPSVQHQTPAPASGWQLRDLSCTFHIEKRRGERMAIVIPSWEIVVHQLIIPRTVTDEN